MLLAVSTAASLAAAESKPSPRPEQSATTKVSVQTSRWESQGFAEVVADNPELAACVLLSPGWWTVATPPAVALEPNSLAAAVADQVAAAFGAAAPPSLEVVIAAADVKVPAAVSFGATTLALLPLEPEAPAAGLAQAVASSLVAASTRPAKVDPRCGEPLLVLGEALATAGSASLATLPATLRPVHDWLEGKDAEPTLATLVEQALDLETPWQARRARLLAVARPEGGSRALAHAAALLVEAYGDPGHARATPFDLLLAWREDREDTFPAMPFQLKRAIRHPGEAGFARDASAEERRALELDVLARTMENGIVPPPPSGLEVPLAARLLAAALARPQGKDPCPWVTDVAPPGLRTGCRSEGEGGGLVYARPRATGGTEVVARTTDGAEGVLLRWPGWVLFPAVDGTRGELLFVDATGVQAVALDGRTPSRSVVPGSFRHLAVSPDGRHLATVSWPSGRVVLQSAGKTREIAVDGRGGLAWLESDVLVASDRERLVLASIEGKTLPVPATVPCTTSLARSGTSLLATVGSPCERGLVAISPLDWTVKRLLHRSEDTFGLNPRPDGSVVFGDPSGLWRWSGGEQAERIAAGLTPGPG